MVGHDVAPGTGPGTVLEREFVLVLPRLRRPWLRVMPHHVTSRRANQAWVIVTCTHAGAAGIAAASVAEILRNIA
jgi:hypothetical protein